MKGKQQKESVSSQLLKTLTLQDVAIGTSLTNITSTLQQGFDTSLQYMADKGGGFLKIGILVGSFALLNVIYNPKYLNWDSFRFMIRRRDGTQSAELTNILKTNTAPRVIPLDAIPLPQNMQDTKNPSSTPIVIVPPKPYVDEYKAVPVNEVLPVTYYHVSNAYPSSIIDMSNWYLTLPIGTQGNPMTIENPSLKTYKDDKFFFVNDARDAVVFRANAGGVHTANSQYPRAELRQIDGAKKSSWSTDNGTHTLLVTQAVTTLPARKPEMVIAQIHDSSDDVVEVKVSGKQIMVFHNSTTYGILDPYYNLGTKYRLKLVASNGVISVYYNDMDKPRVKIPCVKSGCYFKTGAYLQSNTSKGDLPSAYGEVWIYDVQLDGTQATTTNTMTNTTLAETLNHQGYYITDYGDELRRNKETINQAFEAKSISGQRRFIMMAMAMLETNTMTARDRDASKDGSGGAKNVSLWNLNVDMLGRLGYTGNFDALNDDANIPEVVGLMNKAFDKWGIERTLNFVRGGYSAFVDGKSYGAVEYRDVIKSITTAIVNAPSLMTDSRRVEIYLVHV
jgi:hypothetical protein